MRFEMSPQTASWVELIAGGSSLEPLASEIVAAMVAYNAKPKPKWYQSGWLSVDLSDEALAQLHELQALFGGLGQIFVSRGRLRIKNPRLPLAYLRDNHVLRLVEKEEGDLRVEKR